MERLIVNILEAEQEHLPLVGGKGSNLGDLARGLKVPPGFILTSTAYRKQMVSTGLQQKLLEVLEQNAEGGGSIEAVEKASGDIQRLFEKLELLPEIGEAIINSYRELTGNRSGVKVAVRSSATAEDLADASFAGQQETFLDVVGDDQVLDAVIKCWASLWTPRAIHYRMKKNFRHDDVWMAVIIQEMVPSQVSGVMFTANPVTNVREEILIEAASGLGEALVSGDVTGDSYVIEKDDVGCSIKSKTVNNSSGQQLLTDFDIRKLALDGIKIERFYKDFQDVEWAFYKGEFYFLQTRSITTLGDEVLPEIDTRKLTYMQKDVLKWTEERFPNPVHPIDGIVVKVILMALYEAMKNHGYKVEGEDWTRIDRGEFPEFFVPARIRPGLTRFFSYFRLFKILKSNPAEEWSKEQVYLLEMLERLQSRDVSTLPLELITEYITEAFNHLHFFIVLRYHYFMWNRIPSDFLKHILKLKFGKKEGRQIMLDLQAGIPCITLEINERLDKLALLAKETPEVADVLLNSELASVPDKVKGVKGGTEFLEEFNGFLRDYGERETDMGLGGIASPTWQDTPVVVLGIIRGIAAEMLRDSGEGKSSNGIKQSVKTKSKVAERVRVAEEKVYDGLKGGVWGLIGAHKLMERLVRHSRNFAIFRENSHYHVTKGMHVFRILYIELGKRFVKREILKQPRDIFYLTYYEVKEITSTIFHGIEDVDVKALYRKIEQRKLEQERRNHRWQSRLKIDTCEEDKLYGVPASAGVVSGPARIITDPSDFGRLQPGDILVAPYTNPAWTPLFSTVIGLVVDSGGAASHASIIAREYGVPAVMGTKIATQVLTDGEFITIDGTNGIIHRAETH